MGLIGPPASTPGAGSKDSLVEDEDLDRAEVGLAWDL